MREKGVYQKQGMSSITSFLNSQGDFKSIFLIKREGGWWAKLMIGEGFSVQLQI